MNLMDLTKIRNRKTLRSSSYDQEGRNKDAWVLKPHETVVLADIKGPGIIKHIWMTQGRDYRNCLIKITWDNADHPSVLCPLGDFFGLGHGIVNSYQSLLFTASANPDCENKFEKGCALNCYVPMPFKERAVIELINESDKSHYQYFYIDYEIVSEEVVKDSGYFHAEFRRNCPFPGWGHDLLLNSKSANIPNKERDAWDNNYVILETEGKGHYIGCNISVTLLKSHSWWGEGDDMIWVDGYKWPPDLHGTGAEDYLNQAWGMQPNAFMRNGSSIFVADTKHYQTSYVHHLENPVYFQKEIKVTIENGHANRLANEISSVAYWYAEKPSKAIDVPNAKQREAIPELGGSLVIKDSQVYTPHQLRVTEDMRNSLKLWPEEIKEYQKGYENNLL
ncbi:glycoside hydrolase family 172 protein [Vallitalea okinawensis]|uniref:glycoside hydrolase family 172 protein n=1 Tax=Vallitalea okinawensis TaxID=2078660 RepID=UPI0013009EE1|nr:glycoside hydrolase family 172 protein [Vallitalea okinawensis]